LQDASVKLAAFFNEITTLIANSQEAAVTEIKLTWWSEEIARTFLQQPQHPLSKELLPIINLFNLNEVHFQQYIAGARTQIKAKGWDSWEEIQTHCRQMGGMKTLLMAQLAGISQPESETFAITLGSAFDLIDRIRYLGKDLSQGKCLFAKDDLTFFNIDEQALIAHEVPQDLIASLLYRQAHRARVLYQKALEILPESDRFKISALLILAKLYFTLLDEVERDNFGVQKHKTSLTPLRKWWVAWQCYLEEKKRFSALQKLLHQKVTVHG
jgi:phytoene synthase